MKLFIIAIFIFIEAYAQKETKNGRACILPFTYNGVTYTQCTTAGNGNTCWCPISLKGDGSFLESESCKDSTCASGQSPGINQADPNDSDCKTTDGKTCVFPFRYGDKTYSGCTFDDGGGTAWCATETSKGDNYYTNYGTCVDSNCKSKIDSKTPFFSYSGLTGPAYWGNFNPNCDKSKQSPINIDTEDVHEGTFSTFQMNDYDSELLLEIFQNGHTVQVNYKSGTKPSVTGGAAGSNRYMFAQFHLHWGKTKVQGSEHTINQVRYPMEIHFVHYNSKYGSLTGAVNKPDGLFVIGYMFDTNVLEKSKCSDSQLNSLLDDIKGIKTNRLPNELKNKKFKLETTFKLSTNKDKYYTYLGSLTTPPCSESVTWYVNSNVQHLKLCETILEELNNIEDDKTKKKLFDNFRPPQPKNERKVIVKR